MRSISKGELLELTAEDFRLVPQSARDTVNDREATTRLLYAEVAFEALMFRG